MQENPQPGSVKLQVKYDDMMARYASQVAVTTGPEEVYLDFSSGIVPDQATGTSVLPIHTRIAMPYGAVRRFHQLLTQVLARAEEKSGAAK